MNISLREVLTASGPVKLRLIKIFDLVIGGALAWLLPTKRRPKPEASAIGKILIIRPGGIGDAVFILPGLRSIKKRYPGLKVDILCERRNSAVFYSQGPLCDRVYCYDEPAEFIAAFRDHYEAVFDTEQWHYLSALTAYFSRAKYAVGFGSRPLRKKLFDTAVSYDINGYELDSFRELFLSLFSVGEGLSLANSFHASADQLPSAAGDVAANSVSFSPGASLPQKQLNFDQTVTVIKFFLELDCRVLLLGGKDHQALSEDVSRKIGDGRLVNLVGQTSLPGAAAIIARTKLFVGTDSGLLHLACAVGVPTISVFGSSNWRKWGPRGPKDVVLTDNVPCSPCTHFSYSLPTCNGTYYCMNEFNVRKIIDAIRKNLGVVCSWEDVGSAQRLGRSGGSWMSRIFFWKKTIRSRSALHAGSRKQNHFPKTSPACTRCNRTTSGKTAFFIFVKGSSSGARSGGSSVTLKIVFSWMWAPAAGIFATALPDGA